MKKGDLMFYRGRERVTIIRGAFPRHGDPRVVVEREHDKRRFTVARKYLTPVARLLNLSLSGEVK